MPHKIQDKEKEYVWAMLSDKNRAQKIVNIFLNVPKTLKVKWRTCQWAKIEPLKPGSMFINE